MSWPLSQDYNEAIQSPRSNFSDPDLQRGEVVTTPLGIPLPCSGNFADVYELRCPGGDRWAVKCFTREIHGLRERYAAISRHLQDANLPFIVDFTFLEQGIRVRGQWYPILKMQWVEGLTLNEFVREYADKPAMLEALLQIWVRMATRLREAGIAHADLQHGNVLLVPSGTSNSLAVKLVDYDGMFVPALAGGDSGEVGHPCYQHPQRLAEGTYSLEVDRFPLLLVAATLHAVKVGGRALWEKYDSGDNLLFREADLKAPVKSRLFYELLKLGDPRAARLAGQTLDALKGRLESVPLLEEVLPELHVAPASKPVPVMPKRTAVKVAVGQRAAEAQPAAVAAAGSEWDFKGMDKTRLPRRHKGGLLRWVGCAAALSVAALVLAGGIFALTFRQGPKKPKDEVQIAQKKQRDGQQNDGIVPPPLPAPVPPEPPGMGDLTGGYRFVHFGKDGTRMVLRFNDLQQNQFFARVYDQATGQAVTPPLKHEDYVIHASFSRDGQRVVTASHDKTARLWDAATGKEVSPPLKHENGVYHASFSPDSQGVVTASSDKTARLWDVATGKELKKVTITLAATSAGDYDQTGGYRFVHFDKDGTRVVLRFNDDKQKQYFARVYDQVTGQALTPPLKHADSVMRASFSSDGQRVVTASFDMTARVWDAATGKEVTPPLEHTNAVRHVSFSPDGQRVVTTSDDKTARLWDAATGKELKKVTITTSPQPQVNLPADASIADLRQALKNEDPAMQMVAAARLANLGPKAEPAMYALADTLTNEKNPTKVRTLAALAIAHIGSATKPVVPALVKAIQPSQALEVRQYAAEAFAQMKYPATEEGLPAILSAVETDTDPVLRQKCGWSLFSMSRKDLERTKADKVLEKVLDDTTAAMNLVRYDAARKLAHTMRADAPDKTAGVLLHMLNNKTLQIYNSTDANVEGTGKVNVKANSGGNARYMSVEAFGSLGEKAARNPEVVKALKEAAMEKEPKLSKEAQKVLKDFNIEG